MKLTLIRGLPGSGKSTLAKAMAETDGQHYEADQWFVKGGEYKFDASKLPLAHAWCQGATRTALENGNNAIVANTFTKFKVRIVKMDTQYSSVHDVPSEVIERMKASYEPYEGEELYTAPAVDQEEEYVLEV